MERRQLHPERFRQSIRRVPLAERRESESQLDLAAELFAKRSSRCHQRHALRPCRGREELYRLHDDGDGAAACDADEPANHSMIPTWLENSGSRAESAESAEKNRPFGQRRTGPATLRFATRALRGPRRSLRETFDELGARSLTRAS